MDTFLESSRKHWQDGINILLGLWIVISPWVLGFTTVQYAGGSAVVIGLVIAVFAAWALVAYARWEDWVNVILGILLVITPWLFEFAAMASTTGTEGAFIATWNFIIAGVLVAGLAIWSIYQNNERGGASTT